MKKFVTAILTISLAAGLAACGGSQPAATTAAPTTAAPETTAAPAATEAAATEEAAAETEAPKYSPGQFKLIAANNQTSDTNPYKAGMEAFKQYVEERTNGAVTVEVHNGTLGTNESELLEKMTIGALDVMCSSTGFLTSTGIPELEFLAMPYLFESKKQWENFIKSDVGKEIGDMITEKSNGQFMFIDYYSSGIRHYYGKQPISKVEDLKGLTIRTQTSGVQGDFWKATGAIPTSVSWGELYQALAQNTVDSAENAYCFFVPMSHHLAKNGHYISETFHDIASPVLIMSTASYNKLPEDLRDIVWQAAVDCCETERQSVIELEETMKQKALDDGAEINEVDISGFLEIAHPQQDKWAAEHGMTEILEKIRALDK